jgi:8-oxo-dGTP pyrophosphatase MutT (NUDIX family)
MAPSTAVHGPVPGASRQGRHRQRYGPDGERLVAGCVPVRLLRDPPRGPEDVLVLLVSSRGGALALAAAAAAAAATTGADAAAANNNNNNHHTTTAPASSADTPPAAGAWVLPKGGWEDDEAVEAAARRETVEEAGVRGEIEGPPLGAFAFEGGPKPGLAGHGAAASLSARRLQQSLSTPSSSFGTSAGGGGGAAATAAAAAAVAAADGAAATAAPDADAAAAATAQRPQRPRRGVAHMFVLRVQEQLESWPEAAQRARRWVPLREAGAMVRHEWMREVLRAYEGRLAAAAAAQQAGA